MTAVFIALLGLPMVWMGARLMFMGGTPYYLITGALMAYSAFELWRARVQGFNAFAAVLLLTLGWAVWEAGNAFWLVGSRIWLVGLLSIRSLRTAARRSGQPLCDEQRRIRRSTAVL